MGQLLKLEIPHPCSYFLWALAVAFFIRVYISAIEAWSRGSCWFWPVLFGFGKAENTNRSVIAADRLTGLIIGFLEIATFPVLIKANLPEYIGAWLAFKTVNRWSYKKQDRGIFNRYLVANALVLIASYFLARWTL